MMSNTIPHKYNISLKKRINQKGHRPLVLWLYGLSGSGKSTLANQIEKKLFDLNIHTYSLDGDNIRHGINRNLGFSEEDRTENVRRIAEIAKLFIDSGTVIIAAFITPLENQRDFLKKIVGDDFFIECFVDTSLEECEKRDVKGLYKKARAGEIKNFTGISSIFERPKKPDLIVKTESESIDNAVERILAYLEPKLKFGNEQ